MRSSFADITQELAAIGDEPAHQRNLAAAIRARFGPLCGVEVQVIPRDPMRPPPTFDE